MNKIVSVTPNELKLLMNLVERKNSLMELEEVIKNDNLIKKQRMDLNDTVENINSWWSEITSKYKLENKKEKGCWFLNFNDGFIYFNQ